MIPITIPTRHPTIVYTCAVPLCGLPCMVIVMTANLTLFETRDGHTKPKTTDRAQVATCFISYTQRQDLEGETAMGRKGECGSFRAAAMCVQWWKPLAVSVLGRGSGRKTRGVRRLEGG